MRDRIPSSEYYRTKIQSKYVKCTSCPKLRYKRWGLNWPDMPSLGPLCWMRRTHRGAPQTSGCSFSSSGIINPPGIVLEDLPRVCEEAGPELRSLHVASPGTGRTQVGFARVFLGPGRATGRRHVGTDVPEGGGASPRAAFA